MTDLTISITVGGARDAGVGDDTTAAPRPLEELGLTGSGADQDAGDQAAPLDLEILAGTARGTPAVVDPEAPRPPEELGRPDR